MAADGAPKRFVEGRVLRATNPKASKVTAQAELVIELQGNFELSEVRA